MSEWIGKTLGKVRIEKLLGRGGTAEVYLGLHTLLIRPVAVKILHAFLEQNTDLHARFLQEARVVAGLRHPNIVQVFDFDVFEDRPYFVMEHINGPSLGAYLKSLHERGARMPLGMLRHLLPLIAGALDSAHRHGAIHRDVKPGNILLRSVTSQIVLGEALPSDTEPLLADFGLVRLMDASLQTASGIIAGTPAYMSPEQARGETVDHRTDVYSLGVVLYEMLSGHVPFDGDTPIEVMNRVLHDLPPPIPNLSMPLQDVLKRATEKDSTLRFQSAGELSNAFLAALGLLTDVDTLPPLKLTQFSKASSETSTQKTTLLLPQFGQRMGTMTALAIAGFAVGFLVWRMAIPATVGRIPSVDIATPTADHALAVPEIPSFGTLRFQDVTAVLDGISVSVSSMPLAGQGQQYEAWLVGDSGETRRSLGILVVDDSGSGSITFVDGQSRNLLASYDRMEITREPAPDASPNPSGTVMYSSSIAAESLSHVRHVLVAIPNTPNGIGLIHGLYADGLLVDRYANSMLEAYDAGDELGMRLNAEAVLNLIVGNQSPLYGDADGDGSITDPGDGYGLLLNGDSPGYMEGVISHTQYAMQAGGAPVDVIAHGEHVIISVQNVEGWAVTLRDLALKILASPFDFELRDSIVQGVATADQCVNGLDLDGNERVDAVIGEGGIITAYQHAYYMADLEILSGANQVMPPGALTTRSDPDY